MSLWKRKHVFDWILSLSLPAFSLGSFLKMQASEMGKETIFSRPRSDNTASALMCVRKFGFFLFTFRTFISETNGMLDTLNSKTEWKSGRQMWIASGRRSSRKNFEIPLQEKKFFYQRNSFVCWNVSLSSTNTQPQSCFTTHSYLAYRAYQSARSRLCEHARFNTTLVHRADTSEWTLETTS